MNAPEKPSTIAAREVTAAMVRQHGAKRGLHMAAARLGCSERWARGIHYGEAAHISAELAERAQTARLEILRDRVTRLKAELQQLERGLADGEMVVARCRAGGLGQ
jgi:cell division protein FtsB